MATFYLTRNDTLPILEVALKNPDKSAFNGTGYTVKLRVWLSDGTKIERAMTWFDSGTGVARYQWLTADWSNLVASPTRIKPGIFNHRMEYELAKDNDLLTFPNHTWDTLQIKEDVA